MKQERNERGFLILRPRCSGLWTERSYLSQIPSYLDHVYEYDIRQANVSVMRELKILPEPVLDELAGMPKLDRNVAIGKLEKEERYAHLKKDIARGIQYARYRLFAANHIEDHEVLSIKNDAVFIMGHKLQETKFGAIEFVQKNKFSMFHKIESLEFYYTSKTKEIVVKGLSDDILAVEDHQNGMLNFLRNVFTYLLRGNRDGLRSYLIKFTDSYKSRALPCCYYRELNSDNHYRSAMRIGDSVMHLDNISPEQVDNIDISYNYNYFVLPLLRLYLF